MLFCRAASDCGSTDGLTETGSEELAARSSRIWPAVGDRLGAASVGRPDDGLGGASDGGRADVSGGSCVEELDVALEDRLERGGCDGESESVSGRGSEGRSVGRSVVVGRGVWAGVGSFGSVQTGSPSATYHSSLCLFSSFVGL